MVAKSSSNGRGTNSMALASVHIRHDGFSIANLEASASCHDGGGGYDPFGGPTGYYAQQGISPPGSLMGTLGDFFRHFRGAGHDQPGHTLPGLCLAFATSNVYFDVLMEFWS